jgi:hypothetical protein
MNTKILMTLSSTVMFVTGIILSFFPQEVLKQAGENFTPLTTLLLQLTGALYFGFAILNRMAKGNLLGGIYSRPIVIGNFAHFFVAGLALLKSTSSFHHAPYIWSVAVIYAGFAIAFGLVMFTTPKAVKAEV